MPTSLPTGADAKFLPADSPAAQQAEQMRRKLLNQLAEQQGSDSPLAAWVQQQQLQGFSELPPLRVYSCGYGKPAGFSVPGGYAVREGATSEWAVYNCVRSMLADKGLLPHARHTLGSPSRMVGGGSAGSSQAVLEHYADDSAMFWTLWDGLQMAFNHQSLALAMVRSPTLTGMLTTAAVYYACRRLATPSEILHAIEVTLEKHTTPK